MDRSGKFFHSFSRSIALFEIFGGSLSYFASTNNWFPQTWNTAYIIKNIFRFSTVNYSPLIMCSNLKMIKISYMQTDKWKTLSPLKVMKWRKRRKNYHTCLLHVLQYWCTGVYVTDSVSSLYVSYVCACSTEFIYFTV